MSQYLETGVSHLFASSNSTPSTILPLIMQTLRHER